MAPHQEKTFRICGRFFLFCRKHAGKRRGRQKSRRRGIYNRRQTCYNTHQQPRNERERGTGFPLQRAAGGCEAAGAAVAPNSSRERSRRKRTGVPDNARDKRGSGRPGQAKWYRERQRFPSLCTKDGRLLWVKEEEASDVPGEHTRLFPGRRGEEVAKASGRRPTPLPRKNRHDKAQVLPAD